MIKDKAFFFVNYEGLRQLKSVDTPIFVPDANARNGLLPCAAAPRVACDTATGLANVGFASPALREALSLFPATALTTPSGVAGIIAGANQVANENYFLGRFDYTFSQNDSMFLRYVLDRADFLLPTAVPIYAEQDLSRSHIATIEERHVFSTNLVNLARFSFVRPAEFAAFKNSNATASDGSHPLEYYPGLGVQDGVLTLAGVSSIGPSGILPTTIIPNRFTEADDVYLTRGAHNLKFGISIERFQQNDASGFYGPGNYTFNSLAQFMQNQPALYIGNVPGQFNNARLFRELWITPYFQDDWKVSSKLTVNLGLRYDWGANPSDASNNLYQLLNPPATSYPSGTPVFPGGASFCACSECLAK